MLHGLAIVVLLNATTDIILYRLFANEWISEFQFRASGEERGSGNLQLWYVKDGESSVGASSIYTVGQFDGFVLTVDTHGGRVRFFFFLILYFQIYSLQPD